MKQIPKVTNREISALGIKFMDDPAGFLMTFADKFGDVLQFKLGPFKVTLISNPSMIQEVLIGKVKQFPKSTRDTNILSKAIGQGIVTADQQTHKPLRKIAQSPAKLPRCI
ncbi:cytochrome P450 [Pseudoalteromonas luteoviolacea]|uniref:cytochrome P450 n=1 Tax=Pseudoalteromonas luteoviolacea TaxID=43657 RepID=UPI001B3A1FA6|nr:cytochrome P450 [Pseudoalteromonas luteoviolacea]MBQ4878799.1 cytochrome P450 [Pseudoalteromonas luteoviolacea]MBQ4907793.1 cytochrome P450 [Pseudoalteromonas luteoviolacea]